VRMFRNGNNFGQRKQDDYVVKIVPSIFRVFLIERNQQLLNQMKSKPYINQTTNET
jgi:hypothetical protein